MLLKAKRKNSIADPCRAGSRLRIHGLVQAACYSLSGLPVALSSGKKKDGRTALFRCPKAGCGYQQVPGLAAVAADSLKQKAPSAKRKILVRRVGAGTAGARGKKKLVRVVHRQK